ncbi:sugar phosphotransferase, partial [Streptomyces sp. WAC06614]|uniref:sugar phosphotransferase n=1 Tax=Streptomyces sp. WAC06614 TaxID=2487416 RepID=UPI00163BBFDC
MAEPDSMSSAAEVYAKLVPLPVRVAARKVPPRMRHRVRTRLDRSLAARESRLHQRALKRVRSGAFDNLPERRVKARDGRVGHVHPGLTADLARRTDLGLVTTALDLAGIPWFAVPALDDRRLALAVPHERKPDVRRVLRALLEDQTGYVVSALPANESTARIPGSHVKAWKHFAKARVIRLVWLRTDPTLSLWVGEGQGVEIEFWTPNTALDHPRLVGPRPNRVQRVVPAGPGHVIEIPHQRLSGYAGTTTDDGAEADRTLTREHFDVPRIEEVTYPVDAVVLWQHTEPWAQELLRATLRSLHQYAPWVQQVHLVASAPVPAWVRGGERLRVLGAGTATDPALHVLPDTAARFLLFRPGALLGRPVRPFDYFTPMGGTRPRRSGWSAAEAAAPWTATAFAWTGRAVAHGWAYGPQPYTVEVLAALGEDRTGAGDAPDLQYAPELPGTHPLDGPVHHCAQAVGLAEPSGEASLALHAAMPGLKRWLDRLLVRRDMQQFHLMGLGAAEAASPAVEGGRSGTRSVLDFLRRYYPVPSPYEYPALSFLLLGSLAQLSSFLYLSTLIFSGARLSAA